MFLFFIPRQLNTSDSTSSAAPLLKNCTRLHQFISVDEFFFSYAGFCFKFLL